MKLVLDGETHQALKSIGWPVNHADTSEEGIMGGPHTPLPRRRASWWAGWRSHLRDLVDRTIETTRGERGGCRKMTKTFHQPSRQERDTGQQPRSQLTLRAQGYPPQSVPPYERRWYRWEQTPHPLKYESFRIECSWISGNPNQ